MPRPRWALHAQAQIWRYLMSIGMFLHKVAPPRPRKPAFSRVIPTTISPHKGTVRIQFYVPDDYPSRRTSHTGPRFPVVVNFHGGGFTLGTATDDARWAGTVVERVGAVVASVDYRLAPEFHFPTAVEDGVDAIMYLSAHAEELWLDTSRLAISGFSSGGNMAFTVPLRLREELDPDLEAGNTAQLQATPLAGPTKSGVSVEVAGTTAIVRSMGPVRIAAIVAWYPSTDYTNSREQRRSTSVRKDQELSAVFTQLFDESYLQPPTLDRANPYLSPGVAPCSVLEGLPENIILYTCEWDMLRAEGARLKSRLEGVGKRVKYLMIPGVPHGFDKAPNPLKPTPGASEYYADACDELRQIFKCP